MGDLRINQNTHVYQRKKCTTTLEKEKIKGGRRQENESLTSKSTQSALEVRCEVELLLNNNRSPVPT